MYPIPREGKTITALSFVLLFYAFLCAVGNAEKAIQTTPCELDADPPAYDGKLVTVRSAVIIGFEQSSFDVTCQNNDWISIWVTFAGDIEMPIIYCCGDHSRRAGTSLNINGIKLTVHKDDEFKKFAHLLMAERNQAPPGVPCFWDCFQYRVTATLTGHFFAGNEWKRPGDGKVVYMGYGHLGCCSLFVIEKVSEVEFQPTGIPIENDFECDHQSWELPVDRSGVIAQQKAVSSDVLDDSSIKSIGEQLIKEQMRNMADDFDAGDTREDYEGEFEKEKKATYIWPSKDKLKSYEVTFERFDWLSKIEKEIDAESGRQ